MRRATIATDGNTLRLHLWTDLPCGRLTWTVAEVYRIAALADRRVKFRQARYQAFTIDKRRIWTWRADVHSRDPVTVSAALRYDLEARGYRMKE